MNPGTAVNLEKKILLVDDEQIIVDVIEAMLAFLGYQSFVTTSPLEALEMIQQKPFDFHMVITDMVMPVMPGSRLAKKVKLIRPDLPVLLVTGLNIIPSNQNEDMCCIDSILNKPVSMNSLNKAIQPLLHKRN